MSTEQTPSPVTYWNYIAVDELLSIQRPLTDAHDEMQFIVVHQAFELWFKLAIYELRGAIEAINNGRLSTAERLLGRVAVILRSSLRGFDPLMTMSMEGYAEFRNALRPASGFQSAQFRVLEILLGIEQTTTSEGERFYWEGAVQTGSTFTYFMEKYHAQLMELYADARENNLRRAMLRLTEAATGRAGAEAYRTVLDRRDEFPELASLAGSAHDLQQAMFDFRDYHLCVTVFTVGEHAAGTSDAHAGQHTSCAAYLHGVIDDRSIIFPELTEVLGAPHARV